MTDRGEYRALHTVLVDDPDFQALEPEAKLCFYTGRLQLGPTGIGVLYDSTLVAQTGLTSDQVRAGMEELVREGYIRWQRNVVWFVNGLKFEPSVTPSNDNHAQSIRKHLSGLPKLEIVNRFADHYGLEEPFDDPSGAHWHTPDVGGGGGDGGGDTPSHQGGMPDQVRREEGNTDGGEGSLPDGRSPSPGEPGEENPNDETEGPAHPTSPDQLRAWVRETPKPDSRDEFASQHMALGVWALWKGREPPEKKPGPAYDIGAELAKLRRRHGAATNRELALFVAGVCLRRDEGEYGGVDPGEGMTLGFVDALNSDRSGRSEWSLAKQRARQLLEGEDEDAVDRVLADLEPV